jgi:hypothetical protein
MAGFTIRNLDEHLKARFAESGGGVEFEPLPREPIRDPPTFD